MAPTKDMVYLLESVAILGGMFICSTAWAAIITGPTKGTCNPKADMLFVLNGNTSISNENFDTQKEFVRDVIANHSSPPGAVHVGIIVCSDGNITELDFMISKTEILTSLKRLRKPEPNPRKNKKSDCISSLRGVFSTRERQHTARTALIVIGEEGQWSKEDTRLLDMETQEERISLLIVGVGIQSFTALNAIQTVVSENRKFYVLPSYRSLKRLSEELTTGPCLPMSLETSGSEIEQPATQAPLPKLKFYKGCRALPDGRTYIREIPFLGWQQLTCQEGTRIDTSDCKCRLSTEPTKWKPEVTSIATINVLTPAPKTQVTVPTTPMSSTVQDLLAITAKMTTKNLRPLQGNFQDTSPKSIRVQTTSQKTTLKSNPVSVTSQTSTRKSNPVWATSQETTPKSNLVLTESQNSTSKSTEVKTTSQTGIEKSILVKIVSPKTTPKSQKLRITVPTFIIKHGKLIPVVLSSVENSVMNDKLSDKTGNLNFHSPTAVQVPSSTRQSPTVEMFTHVTSRRGTTKVIYPLKSSILNDL